MIESYMGPTARYSGSNAERQSVGLPGHCVECARLGHVAAHPDLGCGDVGCTAAHDEPPAPDWSVYINAIAGVSRPRPHRMTRGHDGKPVYRWVDDNSVATLDDLAEEQVRAERRAAKAITDYSTALAEVYAPNLPTSLTEQVFILALQSATASTAEDDEHGTWKALPETYQEAVALAAVAYAAGAAVAAAPITDTEWDDIEGAHRRLARSPNDAGSPLCDVIERVYRDRTHQGANR